ncbi:hypothetical protein BD626DRAFT_493394 [Schizophyllum amplum]|uniref:Sld7 C-terminal domain-containing protein n=1 Tax=Schizophyllum amplum TaxID=97359 RepID=A0A550CGP2_9AGAR|nr:hypothetical protein BD626DRAFT_493394 [Auriculariopsis ampla]
MLAVPAIAITNPTPPRPANILEAHKPAYRLLYRGALSLPDSHLLLDGLTFSACLDTPAAGHDLLENPLALALESMRGRPSLRFMGTIPLKDIYIDHSGDILLDIHKDAALSRLYFENTFCQTQWPSSSTSVPQSTIGVKIALGDSNGPETTYVIVYARQPPGQTTAQLVVGRVVAAPPPTKSLRLPRPDDPTPRKPPPVLTAKGTDLKRVASLSTFQTNGTSQGPAKRPRLGLDRESSFKIPAVPRASSQINGKGRSITEPQLQDPVNDPDDVFGQPQQALPPTDDGQLEKENKVIVKKIAIQVLTSGIGYGDPDSSPTPPIPKTHPGFKDLYQWVYRGAAYALRAEMNDTPLQQAKVERLVKIHVGMYAPGLGRG